MKIFNQHHYINSLNQDYANRKIAQGITCAVPIENTNSQNCCFNRYMVSFRGAEFNRTLRANYFRLPTDKNTGKPYEPDIYQKMAAENLYNGNDVVVSAPTGTGKTAIAHYIITKNMEDGNKTFYTTPLKALSNDKVREFKKIYGDKNVGILTGDKKINIDAPILIMTTEVYKNMVINDNLNKKNSVLDGLKTVVFDELQYLGDVDRGGVWEQSIMFTKPNVQILSLSGTMANPEYIADWMADVKGWGKAEKLDVNDKAKVGLNADKHTVLINVPPENRHVPLEYVIEPVDGQKPRGGNCGGTRAERARAKKMARQRALSDSAIPAKHSFSYMVEKLQEEDKLPVIFFVFSKREGKGILTHLSEYGKKLTTDEESEQIGRIINEYTSKGKYLGESLKVEALKRGYALHNAGMLPDQKELVEDLFQKKLLKVVISTETLSAGINMPARTTVITALRKPTDRPDGDDRMRYITPNEFHQMAGRAGRRGIDVKGYCYSLLVNKSQLGKYEELINTPSNDIESHLNLDYSFVATANNAYRDKNNITNILKRSLYAYDKNPENIEIKAQLMADEFNKKEKILKEYEYLDSENKLTEKGEMLTLLSGYEQIPIMEVLTSGMLFDLNSVQLAGLVGGLANLEVLYSDEFPKKYDEYSLNDNVMDDKLDTLQTDLDMFNEEIYIPQNKELKLNKNTVNHIYKWAELNNQSKDSINNWKELYTGDMRKSIRDEGTLFREITVTADLLKQLDNIASFGALISNDSKTKDSYKNLSDTIKSSLKLINNEPTVSRC